MFEAELPQGRISDLVTVVSSIADEAVLRVDGDSVHANVVDPAGVAMADVELSEPGFDYLGASETDLGVDLNRFSDVVGMGGSGDAVFLEYDTETRKIATHVDNLTYTMSLYDPQSIRNGQDIPELDYTASVGVSTSDVKRGLKAADMISDTCSFGIDEHGSFCIRASGDTDDVDYDVGGADVTALGDSLDSCESDLSIGYLKDIFKAIPSDEVSIKVTDEAPVTISFDFAEVDGGEVAGHGEFAIAPRL